MAKDKKTVTNAMRLLNASKIKYETVEYEADEVGEHFGEAIVYRFTLVMKFYH